MSFRLFYRGRGGARLLVLLCLALSGIVRAADEPRGRGESIQITAPAGEGWATNAPRQGQSATQRFLDDFARPTTFDPSGVFNNSRPLPPPMTVVVVPDRRTRERLDQEKNWVFVTPEDMMRDLLMRDILNMPETGADGQDPLRPSAMERFYGRLSAPIGATNGFWGSDQPGDRLEESAPYDAGGNPFAGLDSRGPALKEYLGSGLPVNPLVPQEESFDWADLLGMGDSELSPEQLRIKQARQTQIREFREMLELQQPIANMPQESRLSPSSGGTPGSVGSSGRNPMSPLFGMLNPDGSPLAPQAPFAPESPGSPLAPVAAGQPSLTPVLPSAQPARVMPPAPSFAPPMRQF